MFGGFLLVSPGWRLVRASALLPIIDQIPENPNSSLLVVVVVKVFRLGTEAPSSLVRCGAGRTRQNAENVKKINLLSVWHRPCSLNCQVALALQPKNKKHQRER
jgi:hypothetical protein